MLDIYRHFVALRIRWYAKANMRLVLRHWQWFLVAGLLVPASSLAALPGLFRPAVVHALSRGGDVLSHAAFLATVQLAAFLWTLPQRRNLTGGDFAAYAATLPVSPVIRRSVDATLLLIADSPIVIAVAFALCSAPHGDRSAYEICAFSIFLAALLTLQLAFVEKKARSYLAAVAADLLLAFGLASGEGLLAWPALLSAAGVLIAHALIPDRVSDSTGAGARPISRSSAVVVLRAGVLSPVLLIQAKALAARPVVTAMRVTVVLVTAIGTDDLIGAFGFDERSVPTAIAAMALAALVLSGLFHTLREAHATMQHFTATLPVGTGFWPVRDVILVTVLGLAPLGILLVPLAAHGLSSLPALAALSLAYGALFVLLRMVLALSRDLTVLLATMLAAGWTGAAIAAIMR